MTALRDDFSFDGIWWHAGNPDLSLVGKPHLQGGLHLGSLAQARMRQRRGDALHAFRIELPAGRGRAGRRLWGFMRDRGGNWRPRCDAHRWRGKLAMAYLNRYEGWRLHEQPGPPPPSGFLERATDTAFRARFPAADWSIIILSSEVLRPLPKEARDALLEA